VQGVFEYVPKYRKIVNDNNLPVKIVFCHHFSSGFEIIYGDKAHLKHPKGIL